MTACRGGRPPCHDGEVTAKQPVAVAVPDVVQAAAAGRPVRAVWENELGGLTFEIGTDVERVFAKWAPAGSGLDLAAEVARLRWAGHHTAVPSVLEHGTVAEGSWVVTAALPGESAVAERWRRDPATAVDAAGAGLRAFHDQLPVADCPFSWSAEDRVADATRRGRAVSELAPVANPPPVDRLVVCHGDACTPNTLLTDDGQCSGHVDLGSLGVADRWADLAVATWSTTWNYGAGWEDRLLGAYGVSPDPERTAYYRLLWDLGP
jgi:kanamycin kinase